ncbi:MAG: translational GTPase TypA [bacterium]
MTTATARDTDKRNVAIIAHVDHGKTTMVDHMLRQSGLFHENETVEDRVMDQLDQERERGITIESKNASLSYRGTTINLVDTPGHADFGGEVERIMNMVDGAILLVDAGEGPKPQTRFVLKNAIDMGLSIVVCINKIDRDDARISTVVDEVFKLFMDLGASDEQLDFPLLYSVATEGYAVEDPDREGQDLRPLFESIIDHVPSPDLELDEPFQMLVSDLGYSDYLGRLAIGRVRSGTIDTGEKARLIQEERQTTEPVQALFGYDGLEEVNRDRAEAGDIVALAGFEGVDIGDTIASEQAPEALPRIDVEQPTVGITIGVNDGPFSGQEGEHVTGTKIQERLQYEDRNNVAIEINSTPNEERWELKGRGELQLAVMLEEMRRDGYEMVVSKPRVLMKQEKGERLEPIEHVTIDVPDKFVGVVTEELGERGGTMERYESLDSERVRLVFEIPTRGLIGYRSQFRTDTRGTGLLTSNVDHYAPHTGNIPGRHNGALVADRKGKATAYALEKLEERGRLFIQPDDRCYEGMVVGEHNKEPDLDVNVTKSKQLTNFRAAGADDAIELEPVKPMTIERALEWIEDNELIEITPENVRIRCRHLDPNKRS